MFSNLIRALIRRKPLQVQSESEGAQLEKLYQLGVTAYDDHQYSEAAQYALQAISVQAESAPIQYLLASAYFEMADYDKAAKAYSACLQQQPDYPLVLQAMLHRALAQVRYTPAAQILRTPTAPPSPTTAKTVSVIICSIKPERFERVCANYSALLAGVPHEFIGIHDAKSLCEGYNRGIRQAMGDYLIFSHDDIEIVTPDFASKLLSYLERFDLIGIAGTTQLTGPAWVHSGWPNFRGQVGSRNASTDQIVVQCYDVREHCTPNAQAMDGVFLAARREITNTLVFDDVHFDGWHMYDVDFTFSAYLAGFRTAICHDICVVHASKGEWDEAWQRYANVFMAKYDGKLLSGVTSDYGELCTIELASDTEWLLLTQALNGTPRNSD